MGTWTCTACGSSKDIICPVCGREKEAGETCQDCGSEYSHTTCPQCNHTTAYHEPLGEETYEDKIKAILKERNVKYLTYYEILRLTAAHHPELVKDICANDPIDIKNISQEALKNNGQEAAESLMKIKGMTMPLAIALIKITGVHHNEDTHKR